MERVWVTFYISVHKRLFLLTPLNLRSVKRPQNTNDVKDTKFWQFRETFIFTCLPLLEAEVVSCNPRRSWPGARGCPWLWSPALGAAAAASLASSVLSWLAIQSNYLQHWQSHDPSWNCNWNYSCDAEYSLWGVLRGNKAQHDTKENRPGIYSLCPLRGWWGVLLSPVKMVSKCQDVYPVI